MNICEQIQLKMTAEEKLTPEEQLHLLTCKECHNFAVLQATVLPIAPSAACEANLFRSLPARKPLFQRILPSLRIAAALLVIALAAALFFPRGMEAKPQGISLSASDEWMVSWDSTDNELLGIEAMLAYQTED